VLQGKQKHPFVVGHEWSGVIEALGDGVKGRSVGERVVSHPFIACRTCDRCRAGSINQCRDRSELGVWGTVPGAAQNFITIPAANLTPVPDSVPLADAALCEPAVTSLECITVTGATESDRVAVIGTGTLAQIAVQVIVSLGARVDAFGSSEHGLGQMADIGATARPLTVMPSNTYDVILDFVGNAAATHAVLEGADAGARIALAGVAAETVDGLSLAPMVLKNATINGVLHGVSQYDRTLRLMAAGVIRPGELVDSRFPFSEFRQAADALLAGRRVRPKILVEVDPLVNVR
jgi:threonine dehydrogenase-like Zn-dependent dehydrogenase